MAPEAKSRSTDHHGVGQSGCTAGRTRDPALERTIQTRNTAYPKDDETMRDELGTDDRFTGRGGPELRDDE